MLNNREERERRRYGLVSQVYQGMTVWKRRSVDHRELMRLKTVIVTNVKNVVFSLWLSFIA